MRTRIYVYKMGDIEYRFPAHNRKHADALAKGQGIPPSVFLTREPDVDARLRFDIEHPHAED